MSPQVDEANSLHSPYAQLSRDATHGLLLRGRLQSFSPFIVVSVLLLLSIPRVTHGKRRYEKRVKRSVVNYFIRIAVAHLEYAHEDSAIIHRNLKLNALESPL